MTASRTSDTYSDVGLQGSTPDLAANLDLSAQSGPKPSQRRLGVEAMSWRLAPDRRHLRSPRPAPAIGKHRITGAKVRADGPIRLNFRRPAPRFRAIFTRPDR